MGGTSRTVVNSRWVFCPGVLPFSWVAPSVAHSAACQHRSSNLLRTTDPPREPYPNVLRGKYLNVVAIATNMVPSPQNSSKSNQSENSDDNKHPRGKISEVPPRERERVLLEFIDEHGLPLPPKVIFRGLKVQRNITFSHRTVENILRRLRESGEVMRVEKDELDEGRIRPLPDDAEARRTYYFITDKGRERLGRER